MDFHVKSDKFELNIPIWAKNTVISGDSGTGKTYFIEALYDAVYDLTFREKYWSNIDFDTIEVVRNELDAFKIWNKKPKNKLIILDRLDMYITKEWLDFINNSENTFIIMTRGAGLASKIKCNSDSYLELKYSVKNGKVTLSGEPKI